MLMLLLLPTLTTISSNLLLEMTIALIHWKLYHMKSLDGLHWHLEGIDISDFSN